MADYMKFAEKIGATVGFLELLRMDANEFVYNDINVFDKNHPKHNDFIKTLQNPIFKSDRCTINETMLNMKPLSLWEELKQKFKK